MSNAEKGCQITSAFRYVQRVFNECQRLILKIDNQMAPEWRNLYGNRITRDVTTSIQNPDGWLVEAIWRAYESDDKMVNKCITITFWGNEIEQPLITVGKIIYSDIAKRNHWDLWDIWFGWEDTNENNNYESDGKINIFVSDDCDYIKEACVFSLPLISINDEETLIEKIIKPLKAL